MYFLESKYLNGLFINNGINKTNDMRYIYSRCKMNIANITKQLFITLTFQVQHPLPPVSSCTPLAGRHDSVAVWPSSCAPEGSCCCPWLA